MPVGEFPIDSKFAIWQKDCHQLTPEMLEIRKMLSPAATRFATAARASAYQASAAALEVRAISPGLLHDLASLAAGHAADSAVDRFYHRAKRLAQDRGLDPIPAAQEARRLTYAE